MHLVGFHYKNVSIALAIVIKVTSQENKEYNSLPNYISGTTRYCNTCFKLSVWSQNVSLCAVKGK